MPNRFGDQSAETSLATPATPAVPPTAAVNRFGDSVNRFGDLPEVQSLPPSSPLPKIKSKALGQIQSGMSTDLKYGLGPAETAKIPSVAQADAYLQSASSPYSHGFVDSAINTLSGFNPISIIKNEANRYQNFQSSINPSQQDFSSSLAPLYQPASQLSEGDLPGVAGTGAGMAGGMAAYALAGKAIPPIARGAYKAAKVAGPPVVGYALGQALDMIHPALGSVGRELGTAAGLSMSPTIRAMAKSAIQKWLGVEESEPKPAPIPPLYWRPQVEPPKPAAPVPPLYWRPKAPETETTAVPDIPPVNSGGTGTGGGNAPIEPIDDSLVHGEDPNSIDTHRTDRQNKINTHAAYFNSIGMNPEDLNANNLNEINSHLLKAKQYGDANGLPTPAGSAKNPAGYKPYTAVDRGKYKNNLDTLTEVQNQMRKMQQMRQTMPNPSQPQQAQHNSISPIIDTQIPAAIKSLEPSWRDSVPVSMDRLQSQFPNVSRPELEAAINRLRGARQVYASMSDEGNGGISGVSIHPSQIK